MLSVKGYSKDYIDSCKGKVERDIEVFNLLDRYSIEFERCYFNNMVLILETMFIHRMRGQEGKDGNPLNEVRMLANSLLTNQGIMVSDKTIKYDYNRAVLNIQVGQMIAISSVDFEKLSKAFFQCITEKFSE